MPLSLIWTMFSKESSILLCFVVERNVWELLLYSVPLSGEGLAMSACPSPRGAELTPPPSLPAHESDSSPPLPHPMRTKWFQMISRCSNASWSFLKALTFYYNQVLTPLHPLPLLEPGKTRVPARCFPTPASVHWDKVFCSLAGQARLSDHIFVAQREELKQLLLKFMRHYFPHTFGAEFSFTHILEGNFCLMKKLLGIFWTSSSLTFMFSFEDEEGKTPNRFITYLLAASLGTSARWDTLWTQSKALA